MLMNYAAPRLSPWQSKFFLAKMIKARHHGYSSRKCWSILFFFFFYNRLLYTNVVCELSAWLKYDMISFCLDPRGAHRGRDCAPQSHHAHSCATSKAHRPWSQSEQSTDSEHGTATLHRIILWSVYFLWLQRNIFGNSCLFFQELSELSVSCPFFFKKKRKHYNYLSK